MSQVLVIAPTVGVREQLRDVAKQSGVSVQVLEGIETALPLIEKDPPMLVVAENPADDGMEKLQKTLQVHAPVTPLLIYIGERNSQLALKRMAEGAFDCLCPPLSPGDFLAAGKRAVSRAGRRLLTSRRVKPVVWWRQPVTFVTLGVVVFVGLLALGMVGLWRPPFQIYKLPSEHAVAVAGDKDVIWVADWTQQSLSALRVQGDYLAIVEVHKMKDFQPVAVACAPYYLYTASADGKLRRHRREDGLPSVAVLSSPGPSPSGLAWDGETLWSCDSYTGKLYQHDARLEVKNTMASPATKPVGLAWDNGSLWIADGDHNTVWKLTRDKMDWRKEGPFPLNVFGHNRNMELTGFTLWKGRGWIVSEKNGVLVQHRLPKGKD